MFGLFLLNILHCGGMEMAEGKFEVYFLLEGGYVEREREHNSAQGSLSI
jgi:hypothetical protein